MSVLHRSIELLEPYDGKLSCTVLRGESTRKGADLPDLFRILWQIPEKDLLLIKSDYETIANRVRKGEAHLLSEGDTMYLGACRKVKKVILLKTSLSLRLRRISARLVLSRLICVTY